MNHLLTQGPVQSVSSLSLHAIYHFQIAQGVPIHQEISYADLEKKVNLDVVNLRRLVRHAMTNHIIREPRPGFVAHTSSSRLLAEDKQLQGWVGFFSEDLWQPLAHTVDAMDRWPGSQEPRETGF